MWIEDSLRGKNSHTTLVQGRGLPIVSIISQDSTAAFLRTTLDRPTSGNKTEERSTGLVRCLPAVSGTGVVLVLSLELEAGKSWPREMEEGKYDWYYSSART